VNEESDSRKVEGNRCSDSFEPMTGKPDK